MAKRAGIFAIIVLAIVPAIAIAFALGGLFIAGTEPEEAYAVFGKQNIQAISVLLADTEGSAFMVCVLEEGNTRLISILPAAAPKGKQNSTFLSVYQKEGISGLKQEIGQSLSRGIDGYVEVDFSGLDLVADALGGVTMGEKTYTGQELKDYVKNLPADHTGAKAQQDMVLAVGRRFCSAGFWKGQNAFGKFMKITETDLSFSSLMKIGKKLIPALEGKGLSQYCLPDHGQWETKEKSGPSVEIPHIMMV